MSKIVVSTEPKPRAYGLSVEVHVQTTVALTAEDARRRVNKEIVTELGTGLGAGQPELQVVDEQLFWRVPIVLSLPRLGALGTVGAVTVDARTGDISLSGEDQERLINHARWLYTGAQQDKQQQHVKDVTHFLSLRGTLADDEDFDRAMEELAKAWNT